MTSKFALASILLGDSMVEELRRELRRLSPGLRVDVDALRTTLAEQVIKRELIDSEDAQSAQTAVKRLMRVQAREKSKRATDGAAAPTEGTSATGEQPTEPTQPSGS